MGRRNSWKWLSILALIGCLAALWPKADSLYDLTGEEERVAQLRGVIHWLNTAVRPQPRLARGVTVPYAELSPFGVNTFLQQEVELEKRDLSLRLVSQAGFTTIRQEFPWEDIEIHGKGDFVDRRNVIEGIDAWAKYDHIVDVADRYDVGIVARLGNPPAWTRALTDTVGANAPPDDYADFGDFAALVAERYRDRITFFQIWNEPNGNEEWGRQDVDPEAYTRLLCLAYDRIKKANAGAIILAGALTPTLAMDGRNMNDLIFLQRMYQAGAGSCFDIFSAQGYGLWSGATDQRVRPTVINYAHHVLIRDIMVRNGDAHKSIWISEMGWNAVPEELPATYGRVTEEQQARYAVEAYQRAQNEWPWIGVISYWFFKRPADNERDQAWYYFRLMEPDFEPLPAFDALAEYAASSPTSQAAPGRPAGGDNHRPLLFGISSALLFFALLGLLAPEKEI